MTSQRLLISILAGALALPVALRADDDRLKSAEAVLKEMAGSADKGISEGLLAKAKCVVIIPGVKKGAVGIGGQYGRGYIACRKDGGNGWSAPGGIRIEGGSVGLQLGGTDTDVIMLVMNDRGVDRMLASKFTVGADAAVAAGPVGRQATAQTDATMMAEILAWSRARGVFAGVALQGSTLREDSSENKQLYGKEMSNKDVVKGETAVPKAAEGLIAALAKY
jgi:lipid-binding SYLF domain-containing protein